MVANVIGVKKPPWDGPVVETLAQDWSPLNREVQHECVDCHQFFAGLVTLPEVTTGNLREFLEMSGASVVEMTTAPLERSGEEQIGWSAPNTIQRLQMGGRGVDGCLQVVWKSRWLWGVSPAVYRLLAARSGSWAMATVRK